MAMIKCKECEGSVSSDATACPQCGKPIKKMSTLKKVGIGFGGLFVLTGIMNAARPPHTPAAPSASVITPVVPLDMPQPKRAVVIDLSATTLFREYQKNEVAADEMFNGRRLQVTGTITSIDKDLFGHVVLRLAPGSNNVFQNVSATLEPSELERAAQLSKRQTVTLQCIGNGMVIGSVRIGNCTID